MILLEYYYLPDSGIILAILFNERLDPSALYVAKPKVLHSSTTHLVVLESQLGPAGQDLLLERLRIRVLKVSRLPIPTRGILARKEGIGDGLASPSRRTIAMRHVRDKWESGDVLEESLVHVWAAAGGKGPHDVLALIYVNVIAHQNEAVDGDASLVAEDDVTDLLSKLGWRGFHLTQSSRVDAQGDPGHLRLERCERVGDGKALLLADFADLGGGERADEGMLVFCVNGRLLY